VEKFQAVLLDVWREACRHIEISHSTEMIARMLARHMQISRILVRQIDRQRRCLETVAVGLASDEACQPAPPTGWTASSMKELLSWCKRGQVAHRGKGKPLQGKLQLIVPAGINEDVLAGPLGDSEGPCGVLILAASPRHSFNARDIALMEVLLKPFSAALANDHQLHEIKALREVAEADKRSLLVRLGREKLGDTIVGADSGLQAVMERVELVARSDAPVLIFGETGTGKELLARAIHNRSARAAGPVNRVNCGAIPPELIDSQLFGHEQGAFTGAVETRKGWFERADGGTLFLDEIGELPPAAQVRLLRILQDGYLERVGGQRSIHVDVRIVAATHCDLAQMVAEGRFREDLWYRIAVFPIVLPPLRERREDIPELAKHFARRAATRFGLPWVTPSPEDMIRLQSYSWPGNVRELAAVIDRAAILGNGKLLEIGKALGIADGSPGPQADSRTPAPAESPASDTIAPLDTVIRQHIEMALARTMGRIEGPHGAARLLQINPHTLRARMRKLGINWKRFRDIAP